MTVCSVPFDASRPHVARVYDYLLGGKDNFAADRAVGDRMLASIPEVQLGVRAQRDVLGRVVRYLVGEVGLRQLLDIGSGLPTADNVHEIAQRIDPATRVVYLDNDPIVLSHAEALLADDKSTFVVEGDLRDPAGILGHPDVRKHLDWEQPIGLLMCGRRGPQALVRERHLDEPDDDQDHRDRQVGAQDGQGDLAAGGHDRLGQHVERRHPPGLAVTAVHLDRAMHP